MLPSLPSPETALRIAGKRKIFDFGEKRRETLFDFGEWREQGLGDEGGEADEEADGGPRCASNSTFRPQVIHAFMFFCSLSRLRCLLNENYSFAPIPAEDAFSVRGSAACCRTESASK